MPRRLSSVSRDSVRPLLLILSGPSGVGKDAVLSRMKESRFPLHYVVTVTTRAMRSNERDNVDYRFVSTAEFEDLRRKEQLLESANVYGNWYGVPRADVEQALRMGEDTIIKVDVQGVENIKKIMPQAISVFLRPHERVDLQARLQNRKTESPLDLDVRVRAADQEYQKIGSFDYVVTNTWGEIGRAVDDIAWIISFEKCQPRLKDKP